MQRVATSWIVARATHGETAYVPPGRGIDCFLDSHVITYRAISGRAVGGHPDPIESLGTRVNYVPALIPGTDFNALPQPVHWGLVVQVEIVDIEAADIAFDLQHTLIAPVVG